METIGINIKVAFRTAKVRNYFLLNDRIDKFYRSCIVYKFQCPGDLDTQYIGEMQRQLFVKVKEHTRPTSCAVFSHIKQCKFCHFGTIFLIVLMLLNYVKILFQISFLVFMVNYLLCLWLIDYYYIDCFLSLLVFCLFNYFYRVFILFLKGNYIYFEINFFIWKSMVISNKVINKLTLQLVGKNLHVHTAVKFLLIVVLSV